MIECAVIRGSMGRSASVRMNGWPGLMLSTDVGNRLMPSPARLCSVYTSNSPTGTNRTSLYVSHAKPDGSTLRSS